MDNSPKRQGSDLDQLQRQASTTKQLCIWGIQKFFDPKQCLKYFNKNFAAPSPPTHLLKIKNKTFFGVRLEEAVVPQEYNKQYAKSKRVKVKVMPQQTTFEEKDWMSVEDVGRRAENRQVVASQAQRQKVRDTNIKDIVEPLHALEYGEQVASKKKDIERVIENYNRQYFKDAEVNRRIREGKDMPQLRMDEFVECDQMREGYRSKCQFTIGKDAEGQVVIGFNKGSYHNSTIMIESPRNVSILSKNTKLTVALLEHFIRSNFNQLVPYDRREQTGFWRYLVVRESQRTGESLVMVVARTEGVEAKILAEVKEELAQYMRKSIIGLAGLCFLEYNGEADSVPTDKPTLLFGTPHYHQRIFDHTFRVSPTAFLQIHLPMCEVLYSRIIAAVRECDVVLDLGCGIGTIGISVMNRLPEVKVIGVEICQEAVEDAKVNSEKYEVQLGRAEDKIKEICDKYRGNRIVAILDPPRAGFNKEVMLALRRCRGLDNLIYVACNAGAIQDNLLQLTLPMTDRRKAPQFIMQSMTGLDLFPQTNHYEVLYVMKRAE